MYRRFAGSSSCWSSPDVATPDPNPGRAGCPMSPPGAGAQSTRVQDVGRGVRGPAAHSGGSSADLRDRGPGRSQREETSPHSRNGVGTLVNAMKADLESGRSDRQRVLLRARRFRPAEDRRRRRRLAVDQVERLIGIYEEGMRKAANYVARTRRRSRSASARQATIVTVLSKHQGQKVFSTNHSAYLSRMVNSTAGTMSAQQQEAGSDGCLPARLSPPQRHAQNQPRTPRPRSARRPPPETSSSCWSSPPRIPRLAVQVSMPVRPSFQRWRYSATSAAARARTAIAIRYRRGFDMAEISRPAATGATRAAE